MSTPNPEQVTTAAATQQFSELTTDELVQLHNFVTAGWNPSGLDLFQKVSYLFTERTPNGAPKLHALVAQALDQAVNQRLGA